MARSERKVEGEDDPIANPYPVPLYLNQKYVFSVLAMMEGGYAQLQSVKATRTDQEERTNKLSGEVGVTNAFAFLGIKLGGERASEKKTGGSEEVSTERVHTPDSLFARLREKLYQQHLIRIENLEEAALGEYVEFAAVLHKNPLIEVLETFLSFGVLSKAFEETSDSGAHSPQLPKGTNRRGHSQQASQQKPVNPQSKTNQALAQIGILLKDLEGEDGGTFDLVGDVTGAQSEAQLKVVLVLDPSFASDPTSADLVDGEYYVLGKVIKVIPRGSDEKISLLRKSKLGKAGTLVEQLTKGLASPDMAEMGVTLPKNIETELSGPVVQVVPIAIFM